MAEFPSPYEFVKHAFETVPYGGKLLSEWVEEINKHTWISVEERLPDESEGTILVCFPNVAPYNRKEPFFNAKHDRRVTTATYSEHSKRWYIGDMCAVGEVDPAYWMPLPEPPKE